MPGSTAALRFIRFHRLRAVRPPPLLVDMHLGGSCAAVAAVALVDERVFGILAEDPSNLLEGSIEHVPVVRIAREAHRPHMPAAPAGGRHADLHAKLVALVRLALADAPPPSGRARCRLESFFLS